MATIIQKEEILKIVQSVDVVSLMEKGFIDYSNGLTVVPPVGELIFEEPKGEAHIKYGYIKGDDVYCIKIASGFYNNPQLGLASSQGLMLLFSQKTGEPLSILLDEGQLTDIRTAAAGAVAAKFFAPKNIQGIGVIGTGTQARHQLDLLLQTQTCDTIWIWGRDEQASKRLQSEIEKNCTVQIASSPAQVASKCNLIVTTTPSTIPLLFVKDIMPGTHITAVGSDTSNKQELDSSLLAKADLIISDSIPQSKSRGEIYRAVLDHKITHEKVTELGVALQNPSLCRTTDDQISIVDLTGVAVQDIVISKAVYQAYINQIQNL